MKYLIDVGSSTIKFYELRKGVLRLIESKTFDFKIEFDPFSGLSENNTKELYSFFDALIKKFSLTRFNTKLFATGIFRDIKHKQDFIEDFYIKTHLYFNIISHDLEAFYLEKAWLDKVPYSEDVVVINIGGKTTELIFYSQKNIVDKKMLSIGVGTILTNFSSINERHSLISLDDVVSFVRENLPDVKKDYKTAIYTGGELTYMQVAGYSLVNNFIFNDSLHPSVILSENYFQRNKQIFSEITIENLRSMMPSNPAWMNGARACSAIAQAICKHYQIEFIVPSDSNIIDGVKKQEVRTVVVCGSFNRHLNEISSLIENLNLRNIKVLSPSNTEVIGSKKGFVLLKNDNMINESTWSIEALHLKAIEACDAVIVCNFDDYIGTTTSLEIGYAYKCGKKIVFLCNNDIAINLDLPGEIGLLNIDQQPVTDLQPTK